MLSLSFKEKKETVREENWDSFIADFFDEKLKNKVSFFSSPTAKTKIASFMSQIKKKMEEKNQETLKIFLPRNDVEALLERDLFLHLISKKDFIDSFKKVAIFFKILLEDKKEGSEFEKNILAIIEEGYSKETSAFKKIRKFFASWWLKHKEHKWKKKIKSSIKRDQSALFLTRKTELGKTELEKEVEEFPNNLENIFAAIETGMGECNVSCFLDCREEIKFIFNIIKEHEIKFLFEIFDEKTNLITLFKEIFLGDKVEEGSSLDTSEFQKVATPILLEFRERVFNEHKMITEEDYKQFVEPKALLRCKRICLKEVISAVISSLSVKNIIAEEMQQQQVAKTFF